MRIAFVVWRFPVLSEPFILNQIAGLLDRGHDVEIIAINGRPADTGKVHDLVARYDMLARTRLTPERPEDWRALPKLARVLAGPGLRNPAGLMRLLGQVVRGRAKTPLKMLYRAAALLDAGRFDVVHCQFGSLALPVLQFRKAGLLQGHLVTHFRGIDISSFVQEHGESVYDEVFAESDLFLANCDFFRNKAIALGCPADRIVSHGSGLDLSAFPFRPVPPVNGGPVRLVSAGRLVEKKGLVHAVDAVAAVNRDRRRVHYTIIGDGPERERLQARIRAQGVQDSVDLAGWRTHAEISAMLTAGHIFLAPCQTAENGNQDAPVNTLKEAMAIGMPVVATWHGGIPELVQDGASGFLVPERDPRALAGAVDRLLADPDAWPGMARAGRAAVERLYDMNRLNDELAWLYAGLQPGCAPSHPAHQAI